MTGTEIIRFSKVFISKLEPAEGPVPTPAQWLLYLNWAIETVSVEIRQVDQAVPFTLVAGQASYPLIKGSNLTKTVLEPHLVVINGNPLRTASGRDYGLWAMSELNYFRPTWRTSENATPSAAAGQGGNVLILDPPPTADVVSAGESYIAGIVKAEGLTALTETPDLPADTHMALAAYTAIRIAKPAAASVEAASILQGLAPDAAQAVARAKDRNDLALSETGDTFGAYIPDYMDL
ncbi:MAG TPA: hypothetical protein PKA27_02340 [Fimbriimonadaceae bacterium]|nr:hypothetical protein [Fimbriimonadaceae bacterium]